MQGSPGQHAQDPAPARASGSSMPGHLGKPCSPSCRLVLALEVTDDHFPMAAQAGCCKCCCRAELQPTPLQNSNAGSRK